MLLSFILIFLIASGGFVLTYLFARDASFLWRLAAGNIVGTVIFGTLGFVLASIAGFGPATVAASLIAVLLPLILLKRSDIAGRFRFDRRRAKEKLTGKSFRKVSPFFYYAGFALLFLFFFEGAMYQTAEGIFTGGSSNLGDLPFHLGAIFSFTDGNNFPPQNPSFAGARFSYPFIADFITASFMKFGIGVKDAMLAQNVSWAFSLLVILERFVFVLTKDRLAARIAPALLFFSGGLGFFVFFSDYWAQAKGIVDFLLSMPSDYTTGEHFKWGNSMTVMFITQRSLLLGLPLTLIVLGILWKIFTTETQRLGEEIKVAAPMLPAIYASIIAGFLAGFLPLIHLHSLAVLFVVGVFLFVIKPERWREWLAFAGGVALIAVPEILWSMAGSATDAGKFFEWHFGWSKGDKNFFWFWFINTGIFIPVMALGIYLVWNKWKNAGTILAAEIAAKSSRREKTPGSDSNSTLIPNPKSLLLFYLPFVFCFLIANAAKLAPWEWDNIKVLIYWFVGSIPFAAIALAWMWRKTTPLKIIAAACFAVLIFSGLLDVFRTASGQINYQVFEKDAVLVADKIKLRTPPNALFLNAPTYNSAVVLSGRQSLMRYSGHLGSHGIDYSERERDVKAIYTGGPAAVDLMRKYNIGYVLISPEERNALRANEAFFTKYPLIAEDGQYKVYKIQNQE